MGSYVASIFAHANSMGSWSSKLILLNLKYFIKIQSKTYFCSSKKLKRCTFTKHRCTFVAKVRIQSRFIKKSYKMTNMNVFILILFEKFEGIPTIETKDTYGIWIHLIFFEQSKYNFLWVLMTCTTYSLPTRLYRRHCPCTLQIRLQKINMCNPMYQQQQF